MRKLSLILLTTLVVLSTVLGAVPVAARDTLAPITIQSEPLKISPTTMVASNYRNEIARLTRELRLFGVPLAVRIYNWPTRNTDLARYRDLGNDMPSQDKVQTMATNLVSLQEIETTKGAQDGILLLVIVPKDQTKARVAFGVGAHALPVNNLTASNLEQMLNSRIRPQIAQGNLAKGVMDGVELLSYYNLFAAPDARPITKIHRALRRVANTVLALGTSVSAIGLLTLIWWIRQRNLRRVVVEDDSTQLTPSQAAAIAYGRANDAVLSGALYELVHEGILVPGKRWSIDRWARPTDPFLADLHATLCTEANEAGEIPNGVIDRIYDVTRTPRERLENSLGARGLFNRSAKPEMTWILLGSLAVLLMSLFTLLPTMMGGARFGFFSLILAGLALIVALKYGFTRSWATPAGRAVLSFWLAEASPAELQQYQTTITQDNVITETGTWSTPEPIRRLRTLRGFSAT